MFKPRCVKDDLDIEDLRAQISVLTTEINAVDDDDTHQSELNYEEVVEFLKKENDSLREFIAFETKKQEELEIEDKRLSRYIEDDEILISCVKDYMEKQGAFSTEKLVDKTMELFFKLEVLHRKICGLIKKFAHDYPIVDGLTNANAGVTNAGASNIWQGIKESDSSTRKKSLLDILKLLIFEFEVNAENTEGILKVDDTMDEKHIDFLLSAQIIERCSDNPDCVKLKE